MKPSEMQERIEELREEWCTVCLIASEPGQTSVHPEGTVERVHVETRASDADVDAVLAEF